MIANLKITVVCASALSVSLALSVCSLSALSAGDSKDVNEANKQFYVSLNAMFKGDLEPMKKIWSHSKDITYMGPDGKYEHGWEATIANLEKQGAKKMGGHVDITDSVVISGGELAVVQGVEKGQNGKNEPVSIRVTSVYRKENGEWKMIGRHTDTLSFLQK